MLDDVAADLAALNVSDDLDIDSTLAPCVQLSLSTPPSLSRVTVEPGLLAFAHGMLP